MTPADIYSPSRAFVTGRCGKWYAWHDFSGGGVPTLYVTGECWPDVPGIRLALQRSAAQGSNIRILVLETVVNNGHDPRVTPPNPMLYEEQTVARITQVCIQPDGLFLDVILVP